MIPGRLVLRCEAEAYTCLAKFIHKGAVNGDTWRGLLLWANVCEVQSAAVANRKIVRYKFRSCAL